MAESEWLNLIIHIFAAATPSRSSCKLFVARHTQPKAPEQVERQGQCLVTPRYPQWSEWNGRSLYYRYGKMDLYTKYSLLNAS